MRFLRSLLARVRAWMSTTRDAGTVEPARLLWLSPAILREVTPHGVRVYSLCGGCGARMDRSATLCEECAQGQHPTAF